MQTTTKSLLKSALLSVAFIHRTWAEAGNFELDRKAILGMAGKYKVEFRFHESVSLKEDYKISPLKYQEEAFEWITVAEDSGKRIVLQHILQAGGEVVKHWGQIWTFEDPVMLVFQGNKEWKKEVTHSENTKGTWTQLVTQTTDMPRYEARGIWKHHNGVSYWESTTNRPLPRREHTKRSDYDYLIAENRQTVSANKWVHEEDNIKWVQRDGKAYPLCREVGLNTYTKVTDGDFKDAVEYWANHADEWAAIRTAWNHFFDKGNGLVVVEKVGSEQLRRTISKLVDSEKLTPDVAIQAITPYVTSK